MEMRFEIASRNEQIDGPVIQPALESLPHEDKATKFRTMSNSPFWSSPRLSRMIWSEESRHLEFSGARRYI